MKKYTLALLAAIIAPSLANAEDAQNVNKYNAPALPGKQNQSSYDVDFNGGDVTFKQQATNEKSAPAAPAAKNEQNEKLKERAKQFPPYNS